MALPSTGSLTVPTLACPFLPTCDTMAHPHADEVESDVLRLLDHIDPALRTSSTLTEVQPAAQLSGFEAHDSRPAELGQRRRCRQR
jgi:hypothetical protein